MELQLQYSTSYRSAEPFSTAFVEQRAAKRVSLTVPLYENPHVTESMEQERWRFDAAVGCVGGCFDRSGPRKQSARYGVELPLSAVQLSPAPLLLLLLAADAADARWILHNRFLRHMHACEGYCMIS